MRLLAIPWHAVVKALELAITIINAIVNLKTAKPLGGKEGEAQDGKKDTERVGAE